MPDSDAVAFARLRGAGAILIDKTTTSEFGSKCLTDSPLFGRTRNAWDAKRSSGGSTRIPAACNGVVGWKRSNGVIPHSQVQDAFGNQAYVTPTTRSVADTALMMQALAGEDACDPWSIGVPVPDLCDAALSTFPRRCWRERGNSRQEGCR